MTSAMEEKYPLKLGNSPNKLMVLLSFRITPEIAFTPEVAFKNDAKRQCVQ